MRILWQSFLDPREHEPYTTLVRARLAALGGDGVDFDVVGIRPPDRFLHPLSELRCGLDAIRNIIWADRAGYDAAVIGHFQEPGLLEARASVGIPVIGVGEAVMLHACTLGETLGLVTIDPAYVPWHEAQVRTWGLAERVAGVAAMRLGPDQFMAAMEPGVARDDLLTSFEAVARSLLDGGAEVLVPAGVLPAIALCPHGPLSIAGALVPDAVAAAAAEVLAAVRGDRSPAGLDWASPYPSPPPEAVEEFLVATGGPLRTPVR